MSVFVVANLKTMRTEPEHFLKSVKLPVVDSYCNGSFPCLPPLNLSFNLAGRSITITLSPAVTSCPSTTCSPPRSYRQVFKFKCLICFSLFIESRFSPAQTPVCARHAGQGPHLPRLQGCSPAAICLCAGCCGGTARVLWCWQQCVAPGGPWQRRPLRFAARCAVQDERKTHFGLEKIHTI